MARTTRRDPVDQEKHKAKKTARSLIRLKYSLIADDLLNDLIPDIDDAVDHALAEGKAWDFDVTALISEALEVALPARIEERS